jgi:hypothetical protein
VQTLGATRGIIVEQGNLIDEPSFDGDLKRGAADDLEAEAGTGGDAGEAGAG